MSHFFGQKKLLKALVRARIGEFKNVTVFMSALSFFAFFLYSPALLFPCKSDS